MDKNSLKNEQIAGLNHINSIDSLGLVYNNFSGIYIHTIYWILASRYIGHKNIKWHYLSNLILFLVQYFFKLLSNVNKGTFLIFDINDIDIIISLKILNS